MPGVQRLEAVQSARGKAGKMPGPLESNRLVVGLSNMTNPPVFDTDVTKSMRAILESSFGVHFFLTKTASRTQPFRRRRDFHKWNGRGRALTFGLDFFEKTNIFFHGTR
jgi:hypothetical protein